VATNQVSTWSGSEWFIKDALFTLHQELNLGVYKWAPLMCFLGTQSGKQECLRLTCLSESSLVSQLSLAGWLSHLGQHSLAPFF
jgi:hypothetical protein